MSRRWTQVSKDSDRIDIVGFVDINEEAARSRAVDYSGTGSFRWDCKGIEIADPSPDDGTGGHEGLIHDFIDSVQNGTTPETTHTDNIKSLAMVFGAIESAESGGVVQIDI